MKRLPGLVPPLTSGNPDSGGEVTRSVSITTTRYRGTRRGGGVGEIIIVPGLDPRGKIPSRNQLAGAGFITFSVVTGQCVCTIQTTLWSQQGTTVTGQ